MERLLTGRRIGLSFAVDEDAFVLAGQTNAADLPDQLRLLATKLTHPRWDPALFARFRAAAVESFDLHFSSASARAGREMGGVIRPNDQRWRPIEREEMNGGDGRPVPRLLHALLAARPGPRHHRRRHRAGGGGRGDAADGRRRCRGGRAPAVAPERRRAAPAGAQPAAAHLHPSGRSQPGLCADRLVDAGRARPDPRAARAGARRQHVRDAAVRPAARGGGRHLFARRRRISASDVLPRLGHLLRRRRDPARARRHLLPRSPARSSPTSPPARPWPTSSRGRRIR